MRGFPMTFKFTEIPSGGTSTGATTSRNREDILNKASVHNIKNDDNNCFWYALVMLLFRGHAKWKTIRNGGQQRVKLAKQLAEQCNLPWDVKVNWDSLPEIEDHLGIRH